MFSEFLIQMRGLLEQCRSNKIFKLKLFEDPRIFLFTGSEVEKVLGQSKHNDKSKEYEVLHPWLGMGLLTRYISISF